MLCFWVYAVPQLTNVLFLATPLSYINVYLQLFILKKSHIKVLDINFGRSPINTLYILICNIHSLQDLNVWGLGKQIVRQDSNLYVSDTRKCIFLKLYIALDSKLQVSLKLFTCADIVGFWALKNTTGLSTTKNLSIWYGVSKCWAWAAVA